VKLTGRYKGTRRRHEPPIVAECGCGWKSKPIVGRECAGRIAAAEKEAARRKALRAPTPILQVQAASVSV
jgi:hypothetical protein